MSLKKNEREIKEIFYYKFNELSRADKTLFALYFSENLSIEEISKVLEIPQKKVRDDFIASLHVLEKKLSENKINLSQNTLIIKLCKDLNKIKDE